MHGANTHSSHSSLRVPCRVTEKECGEGAAADTNWPFGISPLCPCDPPFPGDDVGGGGVPGGPDETVLEKLTWSSGKYRTVLDASSRVVRGSHQGAYVFRSEVKC